MMRRTGSVSKHQLSLRGRYLLYVFLVGAVVLTFVGIVKPRALGPSLTDSTDNPNASIGFRGYLLRRTDSDVAEAGSESGSVSPAGSQGGGVGSPAKRPVSSSNSDTQEYGVQGHKKQRPDDFASDLRSFTTDSPYYTTGEWPKSLKNKDSDAKYVRGMVNEYRRAGIEWNKLFKLTDQELPPEARSILPGDTKPDDYGYSSSTGKLPIPQQLKAAMSWLAEQDRANLRLLEVFASRFGSWDVETWTHTSPISRVEGETSLSLTRAYPVTDAVFQTAVKPQWKLLVAQKVQEPWRPAAAPASPFSRSQAVPPEEMYAVDQPSPSGSTDEKHATGLPDTDLPPMRLASDFWHHEWIQACGENHQLLSGLNYILVPAADKATGDALQYALSEHFETGEDVAEPFPGHVYKADEKIGTVLLGSPAVSSVARLLVQHKQFYGQHRAVVAIRFWRSDIRLDDGSWTRVYPMLITLTGADGYRPPVVHLEDESPPASSSSESESSSSSDKQPKRSKQSSSS